MEWKVAHPVEFTPNGDKTNQAIQKHIFELERVYSLISQLRSCFIGAGYPTSPVRNQLYINPSTLEARVFVGLNGPGDWRPVGVQPRAHGMGSHTPGLFSELQSVVVDKAILCLDTRPAPEDAGKVLISKNDGGFELSGELTARLSALESQLLGVETALGSLVDGAP